MVLPDRANKMVISCPVSWMRYLFLLFKKILWKFFCKSMALVHPGGGNIKPEVRSSNKWPLWIYMFKQIVHILFTITVFNFLIFVSSCWSFIIWPPEHQAYPPSKVNPTVAISLFTTQHLGLQIEEWEIGNQKHFLSPCSRGAKEFWIGKYLSHSSGKLFVLFLLFWSNPFSNILFPSCLLKLSCLVNSSQIQVCFWN